MLKQALVLCSFLLFGLAALAQPEKVRQAVFAYQDGKMEEAIQLIDDAAADPECNADALTWYYRGFIYKDLYNQQQQGNPASPARKEAIRSFKLCLEMGVDETNTATAKKVLNYLGNTLYNDAATNMNPDSYQVAIENYGQYKETVRLIQPNIDLTTRDIQFNLVLGSVYTQIYETDREANKSFFDKTRDAYAAVLAVDSLNLSANYNLGILYYNEAVNIIKNLPYDTDIITLELIQDECVELFRQSLPYMQRAYDLNPKRKETVLGLAGIYFSLNEMEKSQELQKELELLKGENE